MYNRNRVALFHIKAAVLLLLAGCTSPILPSAKVTSATYAPTQTAISTLTQKPTPIAPPQTSTLVPTDQPSQEQRMVALLQSKGCILPCYLGITPGKSSLDEAKAILDGAGAYVIGSKVLDLQQGEFTYSDYVMSVGDPSGIYETPDPNGSAVIINHYIVLIVKGDVVEGLEVSVIATKSITKFRRYWSRYSVRVIFMQLGAPDHIYLDAHDPTLGYLLLLYDKQDVGVQLLDTSQEIHVCSENETNIINPMFYLYDPNSGLNMFSTGRVSPTNRSAYLPVEEVLGISVSEFYGQVLSNPLICFKPK
jgi:hypothetical protein